MIERHITFNVHPDRTAEFERFFADEYRPAMATSPGFVRVELLREAENPSRYQMVLRWVDADSATDLADLRRPHGPPAGPARPVCRQRDRGLRGDRLSGRSEPAPAVHLGAWVEVASRVAAATRTPIGVTTDAPETLTSPTVRPGCT